MSRICFICLLIACTGCADRSRWGFPWGQGTVDRQNSRAVVHDPYPLNDIGPEVVGGRPRGYMNPLPEAKRNQIYGEPPSPTNAFPPSFHFPK